MIAYAEHSFRQGKKLDDGATAADHGGQAQKIVNNLPGWKGRKVVVSEAPPFPSALGYLWSDFCEISMGLSANGMGPALLTWEALSAWCWLTGTTFEPWEARCLVRLGLARANIESERVMAKAKGKK